MKKKRNIYLATLTMITLFCWVVFSIVRTYQTSTITPEVEKAMTPLDPKINEGVFQQLSDRAVILSPNQ